MNESNKKLVLSIVAVILVLIVGGTVWAVMSREGGPDMAEVQQLRQNLDDKWKEIDPKDRTPEQWRELGQLRRDYEKKKEQLPFAARRKLALEDEQKSKGSKSINEYYSMTSKEDQTAYIDNKLDEMEKNRQRWEAKMAERGPRQPKGGDNPQAGGGGPNPGGGDGQAGNRGRGGPQMDAAQRDKARREHLDLSTPEERAKRADYRVVLKERAQERGMPAPSFFGPPGGGGGRGGPPGGGNRGGGGAANPGTAPAVTP